MKQWLSDNEVYDYSNDFGFDVGICLIDPAEIIALSRPYKEIHDDNSMRVLRSKVQTRGWRDPTPRSLHLVRLPDGKFAVCSGGNHRAILANELELKEIPALVTIIVPRAFLQDKTISKLQISSDRKCQRILKKEVRRLGWLETIILAQI